MSWKPTFYAELAKLSAAGFGIRDALTVLRENHPAARIARVLDGVESRLDAGKSIAEAFAACPETGELEAGMIDAGERGGRLADAFQRLSSHFALVAGCRRDALRALVYPAFLLHLALLAALLPGELLKGRPLAELVPSALGWLLLMDVLLVLAAFTGIRMLKKAAQSAALDRRINRLPWIGKARRNLALSRLTQAAHGCLLAGMGMRAVWSTAAQACGSGELAAAGRRMALLADQGGPLGPALLAEAVFPKAFARSYATAETAGALDHDLARWHAWFEEEAARSSRAAAFALPKLAGAIVALVVISAILRFYLNYFSQLNQLFE